MDLTPPDLDQVEAAASRIGSYVTRTPTVRWHSAALSQALGKRTRIHAKLELLQRTGTFKARGAVNNLVCLEPDVRRRGVTAVSAGNHAIATAYAAYATGTSAKVVMLASANAARVRAAKAYGAEVLIEPDGPTAFAAAESIAEKEGRTFIHPFEGIRVTEATAGVGLELCHDVSDLEAVVVPIGGGGLCSGVSMAVKALNPACHVYGVEPAGADIMARSRRAGMPESMTHIDTMADSLAPPMTTPYAFAMCQAYVDELVTVTDSQMLEAAAVIFDELSFAVEPACAASTAACLGPLQAALQGKRIGLVFCGSNIDIGTFSSQLPSA